MGKEAEQKQEIVNQGVHTYSQEEAYAWPEEPVLREQLELFQTSLREVLGCIKYAKDKERLKEYITENTRMYMENAAAQVIKVITNTPITISEEEEIDMCQAVDEMIEDGREEGRMEGFIKAYAGLIKDGLLSVKEAASRMHMTEEKFVKEMEKVDKRS